MTRKALAGAGLAGVLALSAVAPTSPAVAASSSVSSVSSGSRQSSKGQAAKRDLARRAAGVCRRVPKTEKRVAGLIARFSGNERTKGSVRFFKAQADKVRAKDAQLAKVLDDQAKIREAEIVVLKLRAAQLKDVARFCKSHGFKTGS